MMLFVLFIFVTAPPPEPQGVEFFGEKSDEIGIQWMVPEGFKSFDILSYEVEHWIFGKVDKLRKKLLAPEAKTEYSHKIQDLKPETTYMIRVAAINVHGSNYNEAKARKTLPARKTVFLFRFVVVVLFFFVCMCVFITNCRQYCFLLLGVVSAVLTSEMEVNLKRPSRMFHTRGNI